MEASPPSGSSTFYKDGSDYLGVSPEHFELGRILCQFHSVFGIKKNIPQWSLFEKKNLLCRLFVMIHNSHKLFVIWPKDRYHLRNHTLWSSSTSHERLTKIRTKLKRSPAMISTWTLSEDRKQVKVISSYILVRVMLDLFLHVARLPFLVGTSTSVHRLTKVTLPKETLWACSKCFKWRSHQ